MTNNINSDFERKIKSSLEGYEAPFDAADWKNMESRLEMQPAQSPAFRWNFSMNVIVALVAFSALFIYVFKKQSSTPASSIAKHDTRPSVTPAPANSLFIGLPGLPPKTIPKKNVKEESTDSLSDDSAGNTMVSEPDTKVNYQDTKYTGNTSAGKNTVPVVPLPTTEGQAIRIFPDMVDPRKGVIFNTKEKTGDPVQTEVNVGWNDFVIYNPKTGKLADTTKAPASEAKESSEKTKTKRERLFLFSRKQKKDKTADKTNTGQNSPTDKPDSLKGNQADSLKK